MENLKENLFKYVELRNKINESVTLIDEENKDYTKNKNLAKSGNVDFQQIAYYSLESHEARIQHILNQIEEYENEFNELTDTLDGFYSVRLGDLFQKVEDVAKLHSDDAELKIRLPWFYGDHSLEEIFAYYNANPSEQKDKIEILINNKNTNSEHKININKTLDFNKNILFSDGSTLSDNLTTILGKESDSDNYHTYLTFKSNLNKQNIVIPFTLYELTEISDPLLQTAVINSIVKTNNAEKINQEKINTEPTRLTNDDIAIKHPMNPEM